MSLPTRPLACKRWYHIQRWLNTMVLLLILHLQLRIDTDERLSLVQQVLRICTDNLDENKKVLGQFGQQFLIFRQSLIFSFVMLRGYHQSGFLLLTIILIKSVAGPGFFLKLNLSVPQHQSRRVTVIMSCLVSIELALVLTTIAVSHVIGITSKITGWIIT